MEPTLTPKRDAEEINQTVEKMECEICHDMFTKDELDEHIKKWHHEVYPFRCTLCLPQDAIR
jgi:hypothetical protein